MKHHIGETAGKVWKTLQVKGEVNISQLPRILDEKSTTVYQAVGWLAREDKIEFRKKGPQIWISLTESEKNTSEK